MPPVVPYEELALPEEEDGSVTPQQVKLRPRLLEVPDHVEAGDTLRYVVELSNDSGAPVPLDPCPAYYQAWGESSVAIARTSYLNCDDALPEIAPGGALRFEMELPIRGRHVPGVVGSIVWYLGTPDAEVRGEVYTSGEVTAVR